MINKFSLYKKIFVFSILILGLVFFSFSIWQFFSMNKNGFSYPLRIEKRLKNLKSGQNQWSYNTSEMPPPMK